MERVDLVWENGVDRQRRWVSGATQGWNHASVTFGRLADGRWFAHRTSPQARGDHLAYVFGAGEQDEQLALRLAYRWMSEGEWRPWPAAFGPDGQPLDGLPWMRRGSDWILNDGTTSV